MQVFIVLQETLVPQPGPLILIYLIRRVQGDNPFHLLHEIKEKQENPKGKNKRRLKGKGEKERKKKVGGVGVGWGEV